MIIKSILNYDCLFVLTDNDILHFKYRLIMNNKMRKKNTNSIYWIIDVITQFLIII